MADGAVNNTRCRGSKKDAQLNDEHRGYLRPTGAQIAITAISADQPDALGSVTIQDEASLEEFTDDGCRFSTQGGALGVDAGRIWAKVQCDYLEPRARPDQACRLDAGVFLLENCSQ